MADKNVKASKAAKPAKNILRVTDPNDKRLKMYEDSVLATGRAESSIEHVEKMAKAPNDQAKQMLTKGSPVPPEAAAAIARLEKANKKPYKEGTNKSATTAILEADKGYGFPSGSAREVRGGKNEVISVYSKNVLTPKREVIYEPPPPKPKPKPKPEPKAAEPAPKPKEIERLEPRIDTTRISTPEIVAPVLRPIPKKEPVKEKNIGMGASLRYPSQGLLAKVKRRITGEPNAPYWVDKEGTKRYPSRGENNPQAVREKEMLTKGLNPRNSDDKAALDKVDTYFKKSAK
jgi:hypothetical protein